MVPPLTKLQGKTMIKNFLQCCLISVVLWSSCTKAGILLKRSTDSSVHGYLTELNNRFYEQQEGTAMDNPLLPFLANLFMSKFETEAKDEFSYFPKRTCWWNEICKEEFQSLFRCKCPEWSFCRSPGRYYNAFCSMTNTGYIWSQPGLRDS